MSGPEDRGPERNRGRRDRRRRGGRSHAPNRPDNRPAAARPPLGPAVGREPRAVEEAAVAGPVPLPLPAERSGRAAAESPQPAAPPARVEDLFVEEKLRGQVLLLVGVKARPTAPMQEYDAGAEHYGPGDHVLVESERGPRLGLVAVGSTRGYTHEPLRRVLRRATPEEVRIQQGQGDRDREALLYCKDRVRERKLPMKVIRAELHPASQKAIFYFASEERIDFRDLVRDLTQHLRLRIEMRQIGVRDEAKLIGGIGDCGRELCCTTWLPAFMPVSIKMAKDQGMVLNPQKLSGQCGRLKCCLVYEHDTYKEMSKTLPKMGKRVQTPAGIGKVIELDILGQKARVLFEGGGAEVFPAAVLSPLAGPGQTPAAASVAGAGHPAAESESEKTPSPSLSGPSGDTMKPAVDYSSDTPVEE